MADLTVLDSGLVLAMGKRDLASFAAVYLNVFSAFVLSGHGAGSHCTCYNGGDSD